MNTKNALFMLVISLATLSPSAAVWEQSTKTALGKVMEYVTDSWNNGDRFKGQGTQKGLGMYKWPSGSYYVGNWKNGNYDGYGMQLVSDGKQVNNCDYCQVYVGNFSSDKKYGKGACYNSNGDLIYYGDFSNDKPVDTYPMVKSYPEYKFETIVYDNGNKYIGETKNGSQAGYGIFVWADGDAWFGNWKNGSRNGDGIFLSYNASQWVTQNCDASHCTKYTSLQDVQLEQQRREQEIAEYNRRVQEYNQQQEQRQQEAWQNVMQASLNLMNAVAGKNNQNSGYNSGNYYDNSGGYQGSNNNTASAADCSTYLTRWNNWKRMLDSDAHSNAGRKGRANAKNFLHNEISATDYDAATAGDYRVINSTNSNIRKYEKEMEKISREARRAGCNNVP